MSITVVLGAQWGDEGKGKLVDILCPSSHLVCRCQGGNNAGHTIKAGDTTYDFHILPSGLLNPAASNLIGSGCVVHLPALFGEMKALEEKGVAGVRERLYISERAHLVLDLHQIVDGVEEGELEKAVVGGGKGKIGTTGKGIGPTYSAKAARSGLRIGDVFREDVLVEKVRALAMGYERRFGGAFEGYDFEAEIERLKGYREQLAPMVVDQLPLLVSAQEQQVEMLVEGANAIMLDIDAGTYPFVTSSNTGLGGVFTGLGGINPRNIKDVFGVVKAYTTRVGDGPFPTEDTGDVGQRLQEIGHEFGATTGRRRRCGWLDLVVVKYSTQVNNYTFLNMTKIDVLDTFSEIKVAVAYRDPVTKKAIEGYPADLDLLAQVELEYETFEGWQENITKCRTFAELPRACREYVEFIERFVGVKVKYVGVGPDRDDMIVR